MSSSSRTSQRRPAFQAEVEGLEGRQLLTVFPINPAHKPGYTIQNHVLTVTGIDNYNFLVILDANKATGEVQIIGDRETRKFSGIQDIQIPATPKNDEILVSKGVTIPVTVYNTTGAHVTLKGGQNIVVFEQTAHPRFLGL